MSSRCLPARTEPAAVDMGRRLFSCLMLIWRGGYWPTIWVDAEDTVRWGFQVGLPALC